MNSKPLISLNAGSLARVFTLAAVGAVCAFAAEDDVRIVPQVAAGTSGFEPGVALEWRASDLAPVIIRPEVLISEDGKPGAGAAVLLDITPTLHLSERQAVAIGPRAVYHNSDDNGWELDAMATWGISLNAGMRPWQHTVGVLGAVGILHDKQDDENKVGATGGLFYSYRF